jgi:hypothetical protein
MPELTSHPAPQPALELPPMLTLVVTLQEANQQLALAVAKPEWLGLVSHFTRMPPLERTRVGHSIQAATSRSPFPTDGAAPSHNMAAACETFVSDCVLLAALAEATSPRVLQGTAMRGYQLQIGNNIRQHLH